MPARENLRGRFPSRAPQALVAAELPHQPGTPVTEGRQPA